MTPSSSSRIADIRELDQFLDDHPFTEYFEVLFTPLSGVTRGKRIRRSEIKNVFDYGRFLPGSVLVTDILGADVESTGLVWEDGDADRLARPVSGTITPAPWLGADVAQVMLSMYELDQTPNDLDPRHVLARVLDRFAKDGLTPVVACELEFYLIDFERGENGALKPARSLITGETPTQTQVYGLTELDHYGEYLRSLWDTADAQNIPLEGAISEFAPGQVELTLKHRPDALRACDDAVLYKRLAKGTALRHTMEATFMAKPWADRAGSGFHVHVSVNDEWGKNICASDDPDGSQELKHMIGGMKALMGQSLGIFAPNVNSFKRFKANSYAPIGLNWGVNNRTVPLRVTAGPPSSRHVEHRVAGADANPYLVLAAVLAACHYGLTHKIDPGEKIVGNGYAAAAAQKNTLPEHGFAAFDALEQSAILRDYLGERFVDMYVEVKRTEWRNFLETVTVLDYDWFLRNA